MLSCVPESLLTLLFGLSVSCVKVLSTRTIRVLGGYLKYLRLWYLGERPALGYSDGPTGFGTEADSRGRDTPRQGIKAQVPYITICLPSSRQPAISRIASWRQSREAKIKKQSRRSRMPRLHSTGEQLQSFFSPPFLQPTFVYDSMSQALWIAESLSQ